MNAYRAMMRRKLLEEIYEGLSEDDKRLFVKLTMEDKSWQEIARALQQQKLQLDRIEKGQNWTRSFGSDLLANFTSAGVLWLGSKLFSKL